MTARGERVVYIPDCRECVKDPVPYIRAAMLFAWGDHELRERIMDLDTMEMIYHYFQSVKDVIFIIDQLNALACLSGDNQELKERKGQVEQWLVRYRTPHKCILSTSAQCSQRGSPSVLSQDEDGRQFVVPSGHFLKLPGK